MWLKQSRCQPINGQIELFSFVSRGQRSCLRTVHSPSSHRAGVVHHGQRAGACHTKPVTATKAIFILSLDLCHGHLMKVNFPVYFIPRFFLIRNYKIASSFFTRTLQWNNRICKYMYHFCFSSACPGYCSLVNKPHQTPSPNWTEQLATFMNFLSSPRIKDQPPYSNTQVHDHHSLELLFFPNTTCSPFLSEYEYLSEYTVPRTAHTFMKQQKFFPGTLGNGHVVHVYIKCFYM